jgi:hypothetical protein
MWVHIMLCRHVDVAFTHACRTHEAEKEESTGCTLHGMLVTAAAEEWGCSVFL